MSYVLLLLLLAQPPYQRSLYPHWTGSCLNVREQVLIAESRRPVTFRDACTLLSGEWLDPYTGELVTAPAALDVDHVIPLKRAHDAGGWRWSRVLKTAYANDIRHPEHLVAVTLEANRQKGSKGPDQWRPRRQYWCAYATAWTTIARRWGLVLTAAESRALREMRGTCGE